jgi:hypothetical protein
MLMNPSIDTGHTLELSIHPSFSARARSGLGLDVQAVADLGGGERGPGHPHGSAIPNDM